MRVISVPKSLFIVILGVFFSTAAQSDHSWNDYHWASISKPVSLLVVDSVTEDWDYQLIEAVSQWSQSIVFSPVVTEGDDSVKTRKDCQMVNGKLHVCNARYGFTGWLGQTIIGFDQSGHIDKARVRLNDTYAKYWNFIKRNHVMCHEIGHVLGLAHTSHDGSSQQSCMDLAYDDPLSQWPTQHDFVQLIRIYAHKDDYNSYDDGSGLIRDDAGVSAPVKGKLISRGPKHETWIASRTDGGFWITHILIAVD